MRLLPFASAAALLLSLTFGNPFFFGISPARAENAETFLAALSSGDFFATHRAARAWAEADPTSAAARLAVASTYAQADAPAAAIEHIRAGLRKNPDEPTRGSLLELSATAHGRLGEADAAWVAQLALIPDTDPVDSDKIARLHDAFGAMLAPRAWAATLERVAREAEDGSPAAAARLASLTHLSGNLSAAQGIARRGRERFPEDRALLDTWLRLLASDPAEGRSELNAENVASLRVELEAAKFNADPLLLARARRVLDEQPIVSSTPEPDYSPTVPLTLLSAETLRLEHAAQASLKNRVPLRAKNREQLATLQAALTRRGDTPAPPSWWQAQLQTLAATEAADWAWVANFDAIVRQTARLYRALDGLGEDDFDVGLVLRRRAEFFFAAPGSSPDAAPDLYAVRVGDYDESAVLAVEARLRAGLALAVFRAEVAHPTATPATRLAATDDALASGAMSPEVWHARALAASALGLHTEANFAAVRAVQESRTLPTPPPTAALAGLDTLLATSLRSAREAAATARAALVRGELEPALAAAALALRHDPMQPEAWRVRLAAGTRLGDEALALDALRVLWRADAQAGLDWRDAMNLACRAADWPLLLSLAEGARDADPTLVDAWYFLSLAARALSHDHVLPEADQVLRPSLWRLHSIWAEAMTKQGGKLDADFILSDVLYKTLGQPDEPEGLRLWIAWMEGGRGALGKASPALRARLITGGAEDAHLSRLLGQTGATDYARSEAAKTAPGLAAWVEGVLALSRGDTLVSQADLARAAADSAVPVDLRAVAARWSGAATAAAWRPWRPTDLFHLNVAMAAANVSVSDAAPGQLVLLSAPTLARNDEYMLSQRVRGTTREAALLFTTYFTLRPSPDNQPRIHEWEQLTLRPRPGATQTPVLSIGGSTQLSLRQVDALAGLEWGVSGGLEATEGTGATAKLTVYPSGKLICRDAAWSITGLSVAGTAEWHGGFLDLHGRHAEIKNGGVLKLTDLSLSWGQWPLIAEGGTLRWEKVTGLGNLDTKAFATGSSFLASRLVGTWPQDTATVPGLEFVALPRSGEGEVVRVATTEQLEASLKTARPGQVIRLEQGTYAPIITLTIPAGVTLQGSSSRVLFSSFGTGPVFQVRGPGAVLLNRLSVQLDPAAGHTTANAKKRSLLAVSDGAVVVAQGCMFDWSLYEPGAPSILLGEGSQLRLAGGTYARGSATLSGGGELQLVSFNPGLFSSMEKAGCSATPKPPPNNGMSAAQAWASSARGTASPSQALRARRATSRAKNFCSPLETPRGSARPKSSCAIVPRRRSATVASQPPGPSPRPCVRPTSARAPGRSRRATLLGRCSSRFFKPARMKCPTSTWRPLLSSGIRFVRRRRRVIRFMLRFA